MMTVLESLKEVQNLLRQGFREDRRKNQNIEWLNRICLLVIDICRGLRIILKDTSVQIENGTELCFLSLSQLVCSIKFLERIFNCNSSSSSTKVCHEHFLNRAIWCVDQLKFIVASRQSAKANSVILVPLENEENFVSHMDNILDIIDIFDADLESLANVEKVQETMKRLGPAISNVIGAAHYYNMFALPNDKPPIVSLYTYVHETSVEMEDYIKTLQNQSHNITKKDIYELQLQINNLKGALYKLEQLVNDSLLNLVYEVFIRIQEDPITIMNISNSNIDDLVKEFDLLNERIIQITLFALGFADECKSKNMLRSCLASLEALDPVLVPSILSDSTDEMKIFSDHWREEVGLFQYFIQQIIDTPSFSFAFVHHIEEFLKLHNSESVQQCTTVKDDEFENLLSRCELYKSHLHINHSNLKLDENSNRRMAVNDFKMMLKEFKAIKKHSHSVSPDRILKRIRLLSAIVRRIGDSFTPQSDTIVMSDDEKSKISMADNMKTFAPKSGASTVILMTPTTKNIFYKNVNKRSVVQSDSMIGHCSNLSVITGRENSLRKSLFLRRLLPQKGQSKLRNTNDSVNGNITEILDDITSLATTFSQTIKINH